MNLEVPLGDLYNSNPSHERARQLRHRMYEILRTDLLNFCESSRKILPGLADEAVAAVETVDTNQRLNPALFTHHWQISTGIRRHAPARVAAALGELTRLIADEAHLAPEFTIENLRWDSLDAEIYEFLSGSEGPRTREGGLPVIRRLDPDGYKRAVEWVNESLPTLRAVDPGIYDEFDYFVSGLRLFTGRAARGITSSRCWGKILLRIPDPGEESAEPVMYFLDHITHETSHIVLHAIMSTDPLIRNGFTERYSAPIRWDPRPLYGIYHAMFVLSRISRVLDAFARREQRPSLEAGRDLAVERFYKGYRTIDEHGDLTDAGRQVLESCKAGVDAL